MLMHIKDATPHGELPDEPVVTTEVQSDAAEFVAGTIAQHDSTDIGHYAVASLMTKDKDGHLHFLNGQI